MMSLVLLVILGAIISFIGWIAFIVAAFRVSIAWGLAVLLLLPLAGPVFLLLHWGKARDGFLIALVGMALPPAAFYLLTPADDRDQALQKLRESIVQLLPFDDPFAAKTAGPNAAGGTETRKLPPMIPQTQVLDFGSVGGAKAPTNLDLRTPTTVISPTQGLLENEAQITAAMAELTKRSERLLQRKEALKNSTDQAEQMVLRSEIDEYNKRLNEVRAAEGRLAQSRALKAAQTRVAAASKSKVTGSVLGKAFASDTAMIDRKRAVLLFRQGDEKTPEISILIPLGARLDTTFAEKSVFRDVTTGNMLPISVSVRRGGGRAQPRLFQTGYTLYVEFGEENGESRVFLRLPDEQKSIIEGTFRAQNGVVEMPR